MERPFRFGYQVTADDEDDPVAAARAAEAAVFDGVLVSDRFDIRERGGSSTGSGR